MQEMKTRHYKDLKMYLVITGSNEKETVDMQILCPLCKHNKSCNNWSFKYFVLLLN